jgi:putative tryptophan/tyrosine transport system substrate-binding protein
MNRRGFVALVGTALLPRWAGAQQPSVWRIGWLSNDKAENSPFFDVFRGGMRDLGYIEGRNLLIVARFAGGSTAQLDRLAVELVGLKPHVIVTQGGPATHPVIQAGATMPVVFGYSGDPVESRVVDSLARPGRNFTGVSFLSLELVGKRMELLKEALPGLKRVAIIARPEHPGEQGELRASQAAAQRLGIAIDYYPARNESDLEDAFASILKSRSEAVVVFPDAFTMRHSEKIAAFAVKSRVPSISGWAQFAERGNLMAYGPNLRDSYRRLATYVDKIIKGAKPADLPVELPTSVEFVVNLKTARALGISIPKELLFRADRVIE